MLNTTTHSLTFVVLLLRMWNGTECRLISSNAPQIVFSNVFFQIIDWNIVQKCTIFLSNSNLSCSRSVEWKTKKLFKLKTWLFYQLEHVLFWFQEANTKFDICGSSFKSVERKWASFKKKIFFKYFPFSNTALVTSEMIDQKVIQKFIILLLNSAQHLLLALGMCNRQELFRLFNLKTKSSNTDLRWRRANFLLVTCMCSLLASKNKCPFPFEFKSTSHSYSRNVE